MSKTWVVQSVSSLFVAAKGYSIVRDDFQGLIIKHLECL